MSFPVLTPSELRNCVGRLPRVDLAHLPTPLEEVPRFAEQVGGVRIFFKRDDCTGMLFGGNKTRHNEFLLAEALTQGCDMVIWGAGVQSNNCRQTVAACNKLGLECRLYLTRATHNDDVQGNLLLDHLMGAKVEIIDAAMGPELNQFLLNKAEEFRRAGRKPYVWDRLKANPLAAVSYTLCMAEIAEAVSEMEMEPAAVYVAAAGPTGAGLALGRAVLGMGGPVRLVCPIRWPWKVRDDMAETANQAAALLHLPHRLSARDIDISEDYIGDGYGQLTPGGWEAMSLLARTEGILLDPVYTSKAMAALIHDIRRHRVAAGEVVVFVHTGGTPAVFAYRDELMGFCQGQLV
jgi:1-aminocyclopropane-1-carboxylate deaminase/D-cysteine desulfhydrase-like pyridoxal-dependent ACC family enzyme